MEREFNHSKVRVGTSMEVVGGGGDAVKVLTVGEYIAGMDAAAAAAAAAGGGGDTPTKTEDDEDVEYIFDKSGSATPAL